MLKYLSAHEYSSHDMVRLERTEFNSLDAPHEYSCSDARSLFWMSENKAICDLWKNKKHDCMMQSCFLNCGVFRLAWLSE